MNPDEEPISGNRGSVKGNSYLFAAKAYAFLKGRGYVTSQDVKSIGMDVLRHRVAIDSPLFSLFGR